MPFPALARITRQHAYRLAMLPLLALSVGFTSSVVPAPLLAPSRDEASTAVSTADVSGVAPVEATTATDKPLAMTTTSETASTVEGSEGSVGAEPSINVVVPESASPATEPASPPAASTSAEPMSATPPVAWGAVVSPAFVARVHDMCGRLGCETNNLMAAIAFESAETFSPSVRNRMSGATGLIQFMSDTARLLGTSTEELAQMTAEDQLTYVEAYFRPFKGYLSTIPDIYMAILWPRAVGHPGSYPLFPEGTVQYRQNAHLDVDGDGVVTKEEASSLVTAKLHKGLQPNYALTAPGAAASTPPGL